MESHKHYTQSETDFLLSCAETDENELLDYEEFVERFHEPAKVNYEEEKSLQIPFTLSLFFFLFLTELAFKLWQFLFWKDNEAHNNFLVSCDINEPNEDRY